MLTVQTVPLPEVIVPLDGGASLTFRPVLSPGVVAARRAYFRALEAGGEPEDADVAFTVALAQWGAKAWSGICDEAGAPLPLTAELLEQLLLQSPRAFQAVDRDYVIPALERDAENASAPPPAGDMPAEALTTLN